jgi:hypothetical protein
MQSHLSACREAKIAVYEGAKDNLPDADRKIFPLGYLYNDYIFKDMGSIKLVPYTTCSGKFYS